MIDKLRRKNSNTLIHNFIVLRKRRRHGHDTKAIERDAETGVGILQSCQSAEYSYGFMTVPGSSQASRWPELRDRFELFERRREGIAQAPHRSRRELFMF